MRVTVLDKHDSKAEQSSSKRNIVLGMHSFAQVLASLPQKKNLRLLIEGQVRPVIHNVIWNEYFAHTLLKDINSVIFAEAQFKNVFMKIASKTYRVAQIMQWAQMVKLQHEIVNSPVLYLEGFMQDSSMKFVTIDIGYFNHTDFDVVFQYDNTQEKKPNLQNSTNKSNNKNASLQKLKEVNLNKSLIPINSLFQSRQQKSIKKERTAKYQTQKKENHAMKKQSIKQKQSIELDSARKTEKEMPKQLSVSIQAENNKQREDLVAMLLFRKDEQLKQYRTALQLKQSQFAEKLISIEKTHESDVIEIKKQVQNLLTEYKKKNKTLRKENECLTEMNHKLMLANHKLEQTMGKLTDEIGILKDSQHKLQKSNEQNSSKLQAIQIHNSILIEKINRQETAFKQDLAKKERSMSDMKQKYDRLLGNIKSATAEVDKENIY